MRIVSWTVVVGSLSALLYTSFGPLLGGFKLPPVSASDVGGTMLSREAGQAADAAPMDAKLVMESCDQPEGPGADQHPENARDICTNAAMSQH